MEINWKHLAATPGYISMKAAVAYEAKRTALWNRRPDPRYKEAFSFAINRAKHYALWVDKSIEEILIAWEAKRTHSFISFYSNHNLPKINNNVLKHRGLRGSLKMCKKQFRYNSAESRRSQILRTILAFSTHKRIKKTRWSMARKKGAKRQRERLKRVCEVVT